MGGVLAAGRWNHRNTPIIYCADHPASALLEMLVHFDFEDMPANYQLLEINLPDDLAMIRPDLPEDWRERPMVTRDIGSRFIKDALAPVMAVPSVLVPFGTNYLLNPALLFSAGVTMAGASRHTIDPRLRGEAAAL